jgi:hypothetical protein
MIDHLSCEELEKALMEHIKWPWEAAHMFAEYIEGLEADTGEELDYDPIAIRCGFTVYESREEFIEEYSSALANHKLNLEELKAMDLDTFKDTIDETGLLAIFLIDNFYGEEQEFILVSEQGW